MSAKYQYHAGDRFGRWVLLSSTPSNNSLGEVMWHARCDCGTERWVKGYALRSGHSTSCGCRWHDTHRTHGHTMNGRSSEYRIWVQMKSRCSVPKNKAYASYGGRGIKVCDRWRASFEAFYEDMGPRPSRRHSLDRKDNDGNYCKENCRWATQRDQANNKRSNVVLELRGRSLTMAQWSRELGFTTAMIKSRLVRGWSVEDTLTRPPVVWRHSEDDGVSQ